MGLITALSIGAAVAGSVGAAAISSRGAREQARAAERASDAAVEEQRRQFNIAQQNSQPWLTAGTQALQTLQFLLGLGVPPAQAVDTTAQNSNMTPQELLALVGEQEAGEGVGRLPGSHIYNNLTAVRTQRPSGSSIPAGYSAADFGSLLRDFSAQDFQQDPGYEFRLQEGLKAIERSAASRGTVLSGGMLKEIQRFGQGLASQEFQNAYNRFQQNRATRFNQLANFSGVGQVTAQQLGERGAQTATNIGNLLVGGATAAAAARASGYQNWANTVQNISNIPLNWMALARIYSGGGVAGCWVVQAVYGSTDVRPEIIWQFWTKQWANESRLWRTALGAYLILGEPVAWVVKRSGLLKKLLRPLCDRMLRKTGCIP